MDFRIRRRQFRSSDFSIINRVFPLLSFIIPTIIRFIPEIIAWPYPLGFDTLIYANIILKKTYLKMSLFKLFKSTSLFYLLSTWLNTILNDPILLVKILGPILLGFLSLSLYTYSRKVLRWSPWKSLIASILVGTYFVSLRISWEMYRQMLGFTFLLLEMTALRIKNTKQRIITMGILGFLTVWAHELAAVIFFTIMAIHLITKTSIREKELIILSALPGALLFLYQRYNPATGTIQIPVEKFISTSSTSALIFITGFLIYMYLPLLPLAIPGFKSLRNIDIWSWVAICLIFSYWPLINSNNSVVLWFRWAILLVYPIILYSIEGLEKLWKIGRKIIGNIKLGGILALSILSVNLTMSSYYLTSPPEHTIKYFGEWNNYKQFIQTSMLQNSVSISDTPNVIEAMKYLDKIANSNTVIVLHEAMDNWAQLIIHKGKIIRIKEANLSSQKRNNISSRLVKIAEEYAVNGDKVYTVWWINEEGWYNMPKLPQQFKKIKNFGNIAVYQYQQKLL